MCQQKRQLGGRQMLEIFNNMPFLAEAKRGSSCFIQPPRSSNTKGPGSSKLSCRLIYSLQVALKRTSQGIWLRFLCFELAIGFGTALLEETASVWTASV